MISVVILAAGQSSRMRGADKLLEDVGGMPCLMALTQRALSTWMDVIAVIPDMTHPRAKAARGARLVPSPDAHLGMAHSLRAGIHSIPESSNAALVLPGDMPEITSTDMCKLIEAFDDSTCTIVQAATAAGLPGHPVIFDRSLFGEFDGLNGDRGAAELIMRHRHNHKLLRLEGEHARLDLDTPEEWAAWRATQAEIGYSPL